PTPTPATAPAPSPSTCCPCTPAPPTAFYTLSLHDALPISTFGINTLALVNGQPKVLSLKECLHHYLEHQIKIIERRTAFELRRAKARAHILEGLRIALDHLDEVISLIRNSDTAEIARTGLMERYQ